MYSLAKQINHRPIPKLIAVGLAAAATLAVLLFLAWPVAAQGQLSLSDFDRDGLEVEALALFIAGDAGERAGPVQRQSPDGTLPASCWTGNSASVQMTSRCSASWRCPMGLRCGSTTPSPLSLKDYFGANGDGSDLTDMGADRRRERELSGQWLRLRRGQLRQL